MKKILTALVRKVQAWRDERFRQRIDRVYFRHAGDGIRYIEGGLIVVKDEQTGQKGEVTCGSSLTYRETIATLKKSPRLSNPGNSSEVPVELISLK